MNATDRCLARLQDLPSEIFFNIFSLLTPSDFVLNASRVCSLWRAFVKDEYLWKEYCFSRWAYLKRTQDVASLDTSWISLYRSNLDKKYLSFLVLGAEFGAEKDERLLDVQNKLKMGGLEKVDVINVRTKTPTLDTLREYNAVMFFSYHGFAQIDLGNILAEYVDMGGGVVLCTYANCGQANKLEGRWAAGNYDPILQAVTARAPSLKLGKIHLPKHPVLRGVTSFSGGDQSSHGSGVASPEGELVADWSNGRPLVVDLKTKRGSIVGLNMYPPSSDFAVGGWVASTHGATLLANSLLYAATSKG